MPVFTAVSAEDSRALTLLGQYFQDRTSTFPSTQGSYNTRFPDPTSFQPPNGLFLLVRGEPGTAESPQDGSTAFVGCGGIRRIDDSPSGAIRYEIKHLFLQPKARGTGWGRALLTELEARAKSFGADEIVLDTNASLSAAGALYRRSGYVNIPPYNDNPNATDWFSKPLV